MWEKATVLKKSEGQNEISLKSFSRNTINLKRKRGERQVKAKRQPCTSRFVTAPTCLCYLVLF